MSVLQTRSLASTVFIGGPQDSLATPDVYEIKNDDIINDFKGLDPLTAADLGELTGGRSMAANLPMLENIKVGSLTGAIPGLSVTSSSLKLGDLTGPSILSRLGNGSLTGIPGLSGGLSSLSGLLNNSSLPSGVKQLLNSGIANKLGAVSNIGGIVSKLLPSQMGSSYQMGSLINNLVGGNNPMSIIDRDSSSRLISALSMGGMSSGLNNAFSMLAPLAGGDKSILGSAAQIALKYASGTGNIKALQDIAITAGTSLIAPYARAAMSSFAGSYRASASGAIAPASQVRDDFAAVTNTFQQMKPDWLQDNRYQIDPVTRLPVLECTAVDLSLAREGSESFNSMMRQGAMDDPSDLKYLSMVSMFPTLTPEQQLKKDFPNTVTSLSTNTRPNTQTVNNTTEATLDGYTQKQIDAMNGVIPRGNQNDQPTLDGFTQQQINAMGGVIH